MSTTISQEIVIITKMKKGKEKKISVAFFTIDRESTFLLFDSIIKGMKPICVNTMYTQIDSFSFRMCS